MGDIIDLRDRFFQMKQDSNEYVYVDEYGDKWFAWTYEFEYEGKKYGYEMWARTEDEARAMLKAQAQAEIKGCVHAVFSDKEDDNG